MSGVSTLLSGYGALELKRAYRINMAIGIITACVLHITAIAGTMMFKGSEIEQAGTISKPVSDIITILPPPPSPDNSFTGKRVIAPRVEELNFGPIEAVNEEDMPEEVEFITNDQLDSFINYNSIAGFDEFEGSEIIIPMVDTLLPAPDSFVAYEEMPEIIERSMPIYPEMARRAGVTGDVYVNVLVDKNGNVHDVRVVKDSGMNAGFEEAAVESAYQTLWKPAISNGQPVAVWTTYKISFVIANN